MTVGSLKGMKYKLTKPFPFKGETEHKAFSLYVGPNGSGKTIIMKFTYALALITAMRVEGGVSVNLEQCAQFVFNSCFDDMDFNGTIKGNYEKGSTKVYLDNGTVKKVKYIMAPEVTIPTPPVFMSKDIRTFDSIKTYLKIRKKCGIMGIPTPPEMEELLDFYKLYDINHVESMLHKFKSKVTTSEPFREAMKGFDLKPQIMEIFYDPHDCDFKYVDDKGVELSLTRLSAGEQSLVNMFLANSQ